MNPLLKDLTGQRFGMLVAIRYVPPGVDGPRRHWVCRCDCGAIARIAPCSLHGGRSRSCGCQQGRRAHALNPGQVFGRLTLLEQAGVSSNGGVLWRCQCECGYVGRFRAGNLKSGNTQSCGCARATRRAA